MQILTRVWSFRKRLQVARNLVQRYSDNGVSDHSSINSAEEPELENSRPPAVTLRIGMYVLAALAALATLQLAPALKGAVSRGALQSFWLKVPTLIYVLFVIVYAVDRFWLVRRRKYPAGKALFQVGFALIFSLIVPNAVMRAPPEVTVLDDAADKHSDYRVLEDPRGEVRATVALALGFEGISSERVKTLVHLLDDSDERVKLAARRVLSKWSGLPEGQPASLRAWAETFVKTATTSGKE